MRKVKSKSLLNKYIKKYQLQGIFEDHLRGLIEVHEFEVGELIIREGNMQAFYYFLVEGKAKVCPSSVEGQVVLLDFMTPIDLIGDIEYVNERENYHDVLALKRTVLIAIPLDYVDKYLHDNVHFHRFVSSVMARKIMNTSLKFSRAMMYPLNVRFASYLLEHYEDELNQVITVKFKEVADYFGITARHLRRVMLDFETRGILERKVGAIVVHDLDALKKEAKLMQ
ncbi:cyclic nucleotide-binding domain-containing protein [Acidaminobacter sp. JC074]|uniref:cyclic nucleotide-binding domain-containing protein n=1 Tax=Acidaminobacter sp. JC074 TaxID=2530199 RepID=UPI001F0E4EE9|nr:cyclic nucleotide-binding domain-containing protein [Acidaminobacter sp. JC074]MCH4886519.1 cyclic nucleotide-binding domain-containing protein [Acidaminobacter sp. JC074]